MKRLFFMLIILFLLYLGIQFVFYLFSAGQDNSYKLFDGNITFDVSEKSNFNDNSYSYDVLIDNTNFTFQIFQDYNKKSKVLEQIKYYKDDNYECILPIFKDNLILVDVICKNDDKYNYYFNIKDTNKNLDNFVNEISEYDIKQFTDNASKEKREGIDVYVENLIENHYIGLNNYKGVYIISSNFNSKVYNISLFDKDVYNQKLGKFINQYYVVSNYDENHEFHEIEVVDLVSLDNFKITSNNAISFDIYIQGVVDNKIYLYDKDNGVQYTIDPHDKLVVQVSSKEIRYYNGNWTTMTVAEAKAEKEFITNVVDFNDDQYQRIDKINNQYYLYKKNGKKYDVYRMTKQDKTDLIYLFSTQSIENINYLNGYIYFISENKIKVYNDKFGIKNLIENTELEFNENIKINVYNK